MARGHNPSLDDYEWVTKRGFFKSFLAGMKVTESETKLLISTLPQALRRLRELRNEAEHDPTRAWNRSELDPIVQEFLGIGQSGILAHLVAIGRRIATKGRRKQGGRTIAAR